MKKILFLIFISFNIFSYSEEDSAGKISNPNSEVNYQNNEIKNDKNGNKIQEFYKKLSLSKKKERDIDEILRNFHLVLGRKLHPSHRIGWRGMPISASNLFF